MTVLSAFLAFQPDPVDLSHLQTILKPAVELSIATEPPDDSDFDVLVHGRPTHAWLTASKRLKGVVIPFSGLPQSTAKVLTSFPELKIYNLHHNAVPVAEMAVALLMAAARRIPYLDQKLRQHDWTPRYQDRLTSFLLQGRRVLVLGYGHVGRHVARLCSALGMQVKGIKRTPSSEQSNIEVRSIEFLPDLLPWAQVVILCLPLTSETEGLIDAHLLSLLPADAILVNIARGEIIDEEALYRALADGSIAAAGLDVWFNYPESVEERSRTPPSAFPFEQLENAFLTPHVAGKVAATEKLRMEHLAALLNQLAEGRKPIREVDLARGY
jgi:phosphoglycerate dehydrogenase-like enzyme